MKTPRAVPLALLLTILGTSLALAGELTPRVREFVEERVEMEGSLEVLVEDRADGSRRLSFLLTDSGERYALYFAAQPTSYPTGTRVRVSGLKIDSSIAVASGVSDVQRVTTGVSTSGIEATNVIGGTFGAQTTAVILVNFSDNPVQPYTVSTARSVIATTSNFDLENSYGQTWLTADVFGWYTIAMASTVCDSNTLAIQARAAATAAGVNLGNYNHHVFAFPGNACGWWGLGTVGGSPSSAWINGGFELQVVGHEMGHNFGLLHSHSLDCGTETLGTTCTMSEYGDTLGIMGGSSAYHFNSFQKERLGWLNYGISPPLTTVTSSGTFTIDPYETNGTASKALKIPRDATGFYFYVELRRGLGFDAGLVSNDNVSTGVVVHLASPSDPNTSDLLDMTAGTSSWTDPALTTGQSFTDSASNVTITVNSVSAAGASVSVTLNTPPPPPTCAHVAPSVALVTSQASGANGGTAVNFTLSVTNKDAGACATSTFTLSSAVPSSWTGTLTAATLSIAPGATGTAPLRVTYSLLAADAFYTVTATAKNSADATATASASAVYAICNAGTRLTGGSFSDGFDRADSPNLGSSWAPVAGGFTVSGNVAKNAFPVIGDDLAVVSALAGAGQTVDADFTSVDDNPGLRFGLILRYQDAKNYYQIYRQTGGSSRLVISKLVNGVETILAIGSLANATRGAAFHLTARVAGSSLSLDLDGVNKVNASDSTFTTGKAGLLIGHGSFPTRQQADNFRAVVQ